MLIIALNQDKRMMDGRQSLPVLLRQLDAALGMTERRVSQILIGVLVPQVE